MLCWSSPTAHRICGAADRDAHISALEGGRVVDAVACHADVVAELAQGLHNEKLVVGEHLQHDKASEPPVEARRVDMYQAERCDSHAARQVALACRVCTMARMLIWVA